MIKLRAVLAVCFLSAASVAHSPIDVLIVDGFSNHDWEHTTELLESLLDRGGGFSVMVSTYPGDGETWDPDFSSFDVVIQNCNDIKGGERWPPEVENELERYVEKGGGLYVFHSANNAFSDWEAYNRMIGLGWRNKDFGYAITVDTDGAIQRIPAGEGENTGHGKRVDALVTRAGNHPLHAGLPRQWVAADIEIYRYARGPAEKLSVLSFAKDEKTGLNFPTEWVVAYGEGLVYSSTFGHVWHDQDEPEGMMCAGHQTLIPRIVNWLAGKEVSSEIPPDFPTKKAASLRPLDRSETD